MAKPVETSDGVVADPGSLVARIARLRQYEPEESRAQGKRLIVEKDASYRDGFAGLAVVGELGEHIRCVRATDSTDAEVQGLLFAMDIADQRGAQDVDFVSDRNPVPWPTPVAAKLAERPGWRVVAVSRDYVRNADRLARRALRRDLSQRLTGE